MFDLFRSRAKAVRYLLGAIMMLVALSMVITLIPGFVGSSFSTDTNIIAEIGNEVLTARDVQVNIQQQLRSNAFPREMAGSYVPMIINQMISDRAISYEAERLGFEVTDAEVARAVQTMIPQLFQNGEFVGGEIYSQYLAQMNLTVPEFESNVKKQILLLKLVNIALEGEIVTDEDIEAEYRAANEQIQIEYVSVAPASFREKVTVTQAEIATYYEGSKSSFEIGQQRDAKILVVEESEVSKEAKVPEEELRKIYQSDTDRFRTPERVRARHILLMTTDKSEDEIKQIEGRAGDLRKQLQGGADFASLAKEHSDDTGSGVEGGDLGWLSRGQTVKNFEDTAFSLEPNTLSEVISTEYGIHNIEVMEKESARLQPFDEVKDAIAEETSRQFVFDRIQTLADESREGLLADPTQADALAERLGLTVYTVNKIGVADAIPEIAGSGDMQEAIRTLEKAGVTQVYDLGGNRLGVATVTEIYPPRPAELSEVEDTIRERIRTQKTQEMVQAKRQQLEAELPNAGGDLRKLARALGLSVETSDEFTRNGNVTGLGPAAYMKEAFTEPVGAVLGPINVMGQSVVAKVIGKSPADLTGLAAQRTEIQTQLQQEKARNRQELFADGILTELINDGKVKINDASIQRIVSVYTS